MALYIDDFSYVFDAPSLTSNFFEFLKNYTAVHGVYRPVALVYYYFIYNLYEISSFWAHLFPLCLHFLAGILLYLVLQKQGLQKILAFTAGLLFVFFPMAAEQYMWLSANPGTLANLIFLGQIWLVYKLKSRKFCLALVWILSLLATFLYESTFFMFIPLTFLMAKKWKLAKLDYLLYSLPAGLFAISKVIVKGSEPRPLADNFSLLINHFNKMMQTFFNLFLDNYYTTYFWQAYAREGWGLVWQSAPGIILFVLLIAALGIYVYKLCFSFSNQAEAAGHFEGVLARKNTFVFWLLSLMLSLLPLLANKEFYFGFRSLFLPLVLAIVVSLWLIQILKAEKLIRLIGVIGLVTSVYFLLVCVAMAQKYEERYIEDITIAQAIKRTIDSDFPQAPKDSVLVYLQSEIPLDSRNGFLHPDHILSAFFYHWSGFSCLESVTDKVIALSIEHPDGRIEAAGNFGFDKISGQKINLQLKKDGSVVKI